MLINQNENINKSVIKRKWFPMMNFFFYKYTNDDHFNVTICHRLQRWWWWSRMKKSRIFFHKMKKSRIFFHKMKKKIFFVWCSWQVEIKFCIFFVHLSIYLFIWHTGQLVVFSNLTHTHTHTFHTISCINENYVDGMNISMMMMMMVVNYSIQNLLN